MLVAPLVNHIVEHAQRFVLRFNGRLFTASHRTDGPQRVGNQVSRNHVQMAVNGCTMMSEGPAAEPIAVMLNAGIGVA